MKGRFFILLLLFVSIHCLWAGNYNSNEKVTKVDNDLKVSAGTVDRYFFHSDFVDARNVDIWLPEDYSAKKKYAVLICMMDKCCMMQVRLGMQRNGMWKRL